MASSFQEEIIYKFSQGSEVKDQENFELTGATLENIILILGKVKNNEVTTFKDISILVTPKDKKDKVYPPAVATTVKSPKVLPSLASKVVFMEDIKDDRIILSSAFESHYGFRTRADFFGTVSIKIHEKDGELYALRTRSSPTSSEYNEYNALIYVNDLALRKRLIP